MWKLLHIIAEKIGLSGNKLFDMDEANYIKYIITLLPYVLPCRDCQAHSEQYFDVSPFPNLANMYGSTLSDTVRLWLFTFHNHVRVMKGQEPLDTIEHCRELYANQSLSRADYDILINCITAATRQQWVKLDSWRKWYSMLERFRLLSGTIVV
jgi:hypothetical protein